MRHVCGVLAIATLVLLPAATSHAQGGVDPALRQAIQARIAARQAGDAETYGKYVLDDAVITNAQGATDTRASRMASVKGNPQKAPPPRISDERFRSVGDVTVRTWREDGQNAQGQPLAQRWIEVWVKQAGQWKLANVQFTTIAKP